MMIEIKVEWLPELVPDPQILGLIIEGLSTPTMNLRHLVTIVNHQMWGVTTSWIGCTLRLLNGGKRTGERDEMADPEVTRTRRRGHSNHIIGDGLTSLIKTFLNRINNGDITKAWYKLPSGGTNKPRRISWSLRERLSSTSTSP